MTLDINREIASIRARREWNFLASALQRIQDALNVPVKPSAASVPPAPAQAPSAPASIPIVSGGSPNPANLGGDLTGNTASATVVSTHLSAPLPIAQGGTGLGTTPANGQLLIGNGAAFVEALLTAGVNITIANGAGTITLSAQSGGVAVKTASYTAVAADNGLLLSFNSASAVTLTLPATPPSANWFLFVQNIGAGTLTISPNGKNLDGGSASLARAQNTGCYIATDGVNYFTERSS